MSNCPLLTNISSYFVPSHRPSDPVTSPDPNAASPSTSPSGSKRLRSLSPNDDAIHLDDTALLTLSMDSILPPLPYYRSGSAATSPSSTCSNILRSILCSSTSSSHSQSSVSADSSSSAPGSTSTSPSSVASPLSSPPLSRCISRRSSTSSKSVRFARCTNASVFPCLSGEEYDRTSIVPTCESESLELPKRKRSEAEGWIKCVERERKAALKKKATACTATATAVEGVNGLVDGYLVGKERESLIMTRQDSYDGTVEGNNREMIEPVVGNENEDATMDLAEEDDTPALIQDDSSGDDSDGMLSIASADVTLSSDASTIDEPIDLLLLGSDDIAIEPLHLITTPIKRPLPSPPLSTCGTIRPSAFPSTSTLNFTDYRSNGPSTPHPAKKMFAPSPASYDDHDDDATVEVEDEEEDGHERDREDNEIEEDDEDEDEDTTSKADRYGLCSLGKFTRAEVFQSFDSLGGF